jgi:hypothetical protein
MQGDVGVRELKRIEYRGGVVTFLIPATWKEKYESEGGGTFYEDKPDSGTLRLNIITMQAPAGTKEVTAIAALTDSMRQGGNHKIAALANGNAIARYNHAAVENGEQLRIYYWNLASPVPPRGMRLAVFSYTVRASQTCDRDVCQDMELLDKSICEAEFYSRPGVSGGPIAKPWWKIW